MEVHHHPDLHHKEKKFKEYFLEFLMIFLAVTLGFIAENIRENITESKHEVEYMESLVNDLKLDTSSLTNSIKFRDRAIKASKILLGYFKDNPTAKKLPSELYPQIDSSILLAIFVNHSGAFDQLKSSGSIRLLKNRALADSIEDYYQQIKRIDDLNSIYLNQAVNEVRFHNKLIVAKDIINSYDSIIEHKKMQTPTGYFSLNDPYINEYINQLVSEVRAYLNAKRIHQNVLNQAVRLINQINEEYRFSKK